MTLIRDLIHVPERVQPGDFVLRLSEGVSDEAAAATLRDYVVTPGLQRNFSDALAAISNALTARSSRAGYMHGSFGSGKSHFMAVLFLLLRGNALARSIPEFAGVLREHEAWLGRTKFLCVPFHIIGARSMEQGILGQYLTFVQRQHPDAHYPGCSCRAPIFENARALRTSMGDERFFGRLNEVKGDGEWGDFGAAWTPGAFERALDSPPGDESHVRLVGDLVGTLLPAFKSVALSGDGHRH